MAFGSEARASQESGARRLVDRTASDARHREQRAARYLIGPTKKCVEGVEGEQK